MMVQKLQSLHPPCSCSGRSVAREVSSGGTRKGWHLGLEPRDPYVSASRAVLGGSPATLPSPSLFTHVDPNEVCGCTVLWSQRHKRQNGDFLEGVGRDSHRGSESPMTKPQGGQGMLGTPVLSPHLSSLRGGHFLLLQTGFLHRVQKQSFSIPERKLPRKGTDWPGSGQIVAVCFLLDRHAPFSLSLSHLLHQLIRSRSFQFHLGAEGPLKGSTAIAFTASHLETPH